MIGKPLEVGGANYASVSPDGKEVVPRTKYGVQVFSPEKMNALVCPESYVGRVECVAYCENGRRAVSGCEDGRVRVWDTANGHLLAESQECHRGRMWCIAASADGARIVFAGGNDTLRVCEANSGDVVGQPIVGRLQIGYVYSVAVNKDGTRVVFSSEKGFFLLDVESCAVTIVTGEAGQDPFVAMSDDGTRVACTSSRNNEFVAVWDVHARRAMASNLKGHMDYIRSVAFSGDSRRLVSGSEDRTVRVWDITSRKAIGSPLVHDSDVFHVQSNVDGTLVVSYNKGGYGRLWDDDRGQCVITSSNPEWTSQLQDHGLALFSMGSGSMKLMRIMRPTGAEKDKWLAYFSERHGSTFWPFATIVT